VTADATAAAVPTRRVQVARGYHAMVAVVVLASLVGELVNVVGGHGAIDDASTAIRVLRFFSFFTVQSNILVLVSTALLAQQPDRDETWWRWLRLAALLGITVTGVVYATLLAPIHDPEGTARLTNFGVHYFAPWATVLGWVVLGPRPRIGWRLVGWVLLWPVLWLSYTLVHGEVGYNSWYPYPFVDVGAHGYGQVALNCLGITIGFLALAALFRWLDRRLAPAP